MSKITYCQRQYIDPKLLKPTKQVDIDYNDEFYRIFRENIRVNNVLEPIKITKDNFILSGTLRTQVCIELGIGQVPYEICSDVPEVDEEFLRESYNLHKPSKPSEILHRYQLLKQFYGIRQGKRTELDPHAKQGQDEIALLASKAELDRLSYIDRYAMEAFNHDSRAVKRLWNRIDSSDLAVSKAVAVIKNALQRQRNRTVLTHDETEIQSNYKLYQKDCRLLKEDETGTVNLLFTSVPYPFGMVNYGNGEDETGQEETLGEYLEKMKQFFLAAKSVLADNGSIWVNIADCVRDGEYQLAPEKFLSMMKEELGLVLNDKWIWIKNNPNPSTANRATNCHEHLFHFVKNKNFFYNRNWLEQLPSKTITTLGESLIEYEVCSIKEKIKNNSITTNSASTKALRSECDKHGFSSTHSATFPIDIPLIGILSCTKPGDIVLDICNGTGVTGEASLQLGRSYIGYDVNKEFLRATKVRLSRLQQQ